MVIKKNDKIQFRNLSEFCITWQFQELALHQSLGIWKIWSVNVQFNYFSIFVSLKKIIIIHSNFTIPSCVNRHKKDIKGWSIDWRNDELGSNIGKLIICFRSFILSQYILLYRRAMPLCLADYNLLYCGPTLHQNRGIPLGLTWNFD